MEEVSCVPTAGPLPSEASHSCWEGEGCVEGVMLGEGGPGWR